MDVLALVRGHMFVGGPQVSRASDLAGARLVRNPLKNDVGNRVGGMGAEGRGPGWGAGLQGGPQAGARGGGVGGVSGGAGALQLRRAGRQAGWREAAGP